MSNNKEIFSQEDSDRLIKHHIELSKKQLEKAFEKLEKDENFNRKIKTLTNRGKYTR